MYGNVLEKFFNKIFLNDTTIQIKFDVHQSCRHQRSLTFFLKNIINFIKLVSKKI